MAGPERPEPIWRSAAAVLPVTLSGPRPQTRLPQPGPRHPVPPPLQWHCFPLGRVVSADGQLEPGGGGFFMDGPASPPSLTALTGFIERKKHEFVPRSPQSWSTRSYTFTLACVVCSKISSHAWRKRLFQRPGFCGALPERSRTRAFPGLPRHGGGVLATEGLAKYGKALYPLLRYSVECACHPGRATPPRLIGQPGQRKPAPVCRAGVCKTTTHNCFRPQVKHPSASGRGKAVECVPM